MSEFIYYWNTEFHRIYVDEFIPGAKIQMRLFGVIFKHCGISAIMIPHFSISLLVPGVTRHCNPRYEKSIKKAVEVKALHL